ncbi:MAG: hypothetical protein KJ066_18605 [Acidobacteria bacterium]|nr:hypothetical protein [Acidobacteriota bacterium]
MMSPVLIAHSGTALFSILAAALLAPGLVLAQPNDPAATWAMSATTAHPPELTASNGLRPYEPAATIAIDPSGLPKNLHVDEYYRGLVQRMWQQSPTFRRQCARIAAEPRLTVVVGQGLTRSGARAVTRLTRGAEGRDEATVVIGPGGGAAELLAHELEHIVEWLDGADYLHHTEDVKTVVPRELVFETTRAVEAGRIVASELRAPRS